MFSVKVRDGMLLLGRLCINAFPKQKFAKIAKYQELTIVVTT